MTDTGNSPDTTPAPDLTTDTDPTTANREAPMKHVTHWINGAPYVATESEVPADRVGAALTALRDKAVDLIDPERSGDIYDPATGKGQRHCRLRLRPDHG